MEGRSSFRFFCSTFDSTSVVFLVFKVLECFDGAAFSLAAIHKIVRYRVESSRVETNHTLSIKNNNVRRTLPRLE